MENDCNAIPLKVLLMGIHIYLQWTLLKVKFQPSSFIVFGPHELYAVSLYVNTKNVILSCQLSKSNYKDHTNTVLLRY